MTTAEDRQKIERLRRWVLSTSPAEFADSTALRFRLDAELLLEALTEAELERDLARSELEQRSRPPEEDLAELARDTPARAALRMVSSAPRPDWTLVAGGAQRLRGIVDELGPAYSAVIDANQAWLRDAFDAVGLTVTDERTLYVAIVSHSLLLGMIENAVRGGRASVRTLHDVAVVNQTFVASIFDYLPPEAKR